MEASLTKLSERLDVRGEWKGGNKNDAKSFGAGNWLDDGGSYDIEETKQEISGSKYWFLSFAFDI